MAGGGSVIMGAKRSAARVRHAAAADLDALARIERKCFDPGKFKWVLSRRGFAHHLRNPRAVLLVAEITLDGHAVTIGYGLALVRSNSDYFKISSLAVLPRFRERGVGQKLMLELERVASARGYLVTALDIRSDDVVLFRRYARRGYRRHKSIRGFHPDGSDVIRLVKPVRGGVVRPGVQRNT
jgi:ribosomal protein S18 acetylase RimI-like enzyme